MSCEPSARPPKRPSATILQPKSVALVDLDGTVIGDLTVDGLSVSVYDLGAEFTPEEVPDLEAEFASLVNQMVGGLENGAAEGPLESVEVNGVPGFKVTYTYTNEDTEMQASTVFLVKGQYEYMVTSQATADRWDEICLLYTSPSPRDRS